MKVLLGIVIALLLIVAIGGLVGVGMWIRLAALHRETEKIKKTGYPQDSV